MVPTRARFVALATVVAATVLAGAAGGWWVAGEPGRYSATVIEVIDGDTVVVMFGDRTRAVVRLLGVDTPETKHPTVGVECFGPEASQFSHERLEGRAVELEFDRERIDKYGRYLAHLWIDGRRFSDELLANGLAEWFVLPPNGRYARRQLETELRARALRRGMWGQCGG